jgi:hypothetical protein
MVDKRHRTSMSGIKVMEQTSWGLSKAQERYGKSEYVFGAPRPKGSPFPTDREGRPADFNDTSGWVRAAGESAEGKPGYGQSKPRQR